MLRQVRVDSILNSLQEIKKDGKTYFTFVANTKDSEGEGRVFLFTDRPKFKKIESQTYVVYPYETEAGVIDFWIDSSRKAYVVSMSSLNDEFMGKGLGSAMYKQLFKTANTRKHSVFSDNVLSSQSFKLYKSLAAKGLLSMPTSEGTFYPVPELFNSKQRVLLNEKGEVFVGTPIHHKTEMVAVNSNLFKFSGTLEEYKNKYANISPEKLERLFETRKAFTHIPTPFRATNGMAASFKVNLKPFEVPEKVAKQVGYSGKVVYRSAFKKSGKKPNAATKDNKSVSKPKVKSKPAGKKDWWDTMNYEEQKKYLKDYPNSKKKITKQPGV